VRGTLLDAREAVHLLLAELEADLRDHDEWADVAGWVDRLFARGTSAARQRRAGLRTGDRRAVAALLVREGAVRGGR
jgi:hypothetical protein